MGGVDVLLVHMVELAAVGALGIVFYMLNKKYNRPVLFLEYWVFSYPYAILLIIGL